jgi:hypothetical protein
MASLRHGFEEPGDVQEIRLVVDTIPTLAWSARVLARRHARWIEALNLLCREQKRQSFRALLGAQAQSSPELVSRRQVLGWVEVAQTSASPDHLPDHLVCLSALAGVLCGQSARQVPGPLNYQAVLSFLPNETVERRLGRTQVSQWQSNLCNPSLPRLPS